MAIPEDERVSIFSGSVVVDTHNTSGFGQAGAVPMVAIYTSCRQISRGPGAGTGLQPGPRPQLAQVPWQPRAGHRPEGLRDPKVFWHVPTARWVMAVVPPDDHQVSFYASGDLKQWSHLSDSARRVKMVASGNALT